MNLNSGLILYFPNSWAVLCWVQLSHQLVCVRQLFERANPIRTLLFGFEVFWDAQQILTLSNWKACSNFTRRKHETTDENCESVGMENKTHDRIWCWVLSFFKGKDVNRHSNKTKRLMLVSFRSILSTTFTISQKAKKHSSKHRQDVIKICSRLK